MPKNATQENLTTGHIGYFGKYDDDDPWPSEGFRPSTLGVDFPCFGPPSCCSARQVLPFVVILFGVDFCFAFQVQFINFHFFSVLCVLSFPKFQERVWDCVGVSQSITAIFLCFVVPFKAISIWIFNRICHAPQVSSPITHLRGPNSHPAFSHKFSFIAFSAHLSWRCHLVQKEKQKIKGRINSWPFDTF